MCFEGYIKIPKDGKYTFYLKADTKAFLRIHDAQVIDADFGYESSIEESASILLMEGLHSFKLYYLQKMTENPLLDFEWSGDDFKKETIPVNLFFK